METYNKIITQYIREQDTEVKKVILKICSKSNWSIPETVEDILYKCGMISVDCRLSLTSKNKYYGIINFQKGNIFKEVNDILNVTPTISSQKRVEELLSNKVISLLNFVSIQALENCVNNN